ncbi:Cdc6-like AAA superfamily ATPase [Variovorax boronicumulans]|uniref:AAA family ATPase n=1 Tax=Variovorax boronicumulans TaxID=436515 RepID=UPI00278904E4|nr:AAA family ATPase [Variovorax boronicumulans]MDP9917029.1 Cdc6-like AAA superfamily ATPase [Variovorax boronicumulans]
MKFNPFKPGSIVHPGMFAGRLDEIKELEKALFQTSQGNPCHFLIHGERGIGKSSLLLVVDGTAKGFAGIFLDKDQKLNFLTVSVELEPNDEYVDLISKIARELQRSLDDDDVLKAQLKSVWAFITKWEVLGVKYKRETTPVEAMLEELSEKLIAVSKGMGPRWSGIYIFIDEADKPTSGAGLGEFVKVLTERLTKKRVENVALGIIGISNVIQKMKDSHESSVRILTPVHLKPLTPEDSKKVVARGLDSLSKSKHKAPSITPKALDIIANYSEGYPYFIQQYAYSAFDHDSDDNIDEQDVVQALTKEKGALQLLGQRYFENMYTDEIRSDDYRKVLQVIAQRMPENSTKKQITEESGLKSHTINNALVALKKRGSVLPVSGKDGVYRLPSQSFAAWILAFKVNAVLQASAPLPKPGS